MSCLSVVLENLTFAVKLEPHRGHFTLDTSSTFRRFHFNVINVLNAGLAIMCYVVVCFCT